jgi:hypothetical protein
LKQSKKEIKLIIAMAEAQLPRLLPPIFQPESDTPESWLKEYEYIADNSNWTDEHKIAYFRQFVPQSVKKWYDTKTQIVKYKKEDWKLLKQDFSVEFSPEKVLVTPEIALVARKLSTTETVRNYITDKISLCYSSSKSMSEERMLGHILDGVSESWKSHLKLRTDVTFKNVHDILVRYREFSPTEGISCVGVAAAAAPVYRSYDNPLDTRIVDMIDKKFKQLESRLTDQPKFRNVVPNKNNNNYSEYKQKRMEHATYECYFCGLKGHIKRNCFKYQRSCQLKQGTQQVYRGRGRGNSQTQFNSRNKSFYNNSTNPGN